MAFESVSDAKISSLLTLPKKITNPNTREADKRSHLQRNYLVRGPDGQEFTLYLRQNKRIKNDFSCGLSWYTPSGETLTLVRYNGSSHSHLNRVE